jgi:hypothetical protein
MSQTAKQSILLRSHMLKMSLLSQRATDYSIKAYALNCSELCKQVNRVKQEVNKLELCIGDRGRSLLAAEIDSHSLLACCSLRIYSALQIIVMAAIEIAHNTQVIAARGRKTEFPQTVKAGEFVNGLVRLCSVALFQQEIALAKKILQVEGGRRKIELVQHRARLDLLRRSDTDCRPEMAVMNCIGHIAEQSYEIADELILCLEGSGPGFAAAGQRLNSEAVTAGLRVIHAGNWRVCSSA